MTIFDSTIEQIQINSDSGTVGSGLSVNNNGGVVDDEFIVVFSSSSAGSIYGSRTGHVHDFSDLSSAMSPENSDAGDEYYFTIPSSFFQGTWAADDTYSFKTTATKDQVVQLSNHYKYMVASGSIDLDSDVIKAILCDSTLTFDVDTHATYTNVSSYELSGTNGYTVGGETLVRDGSLTEDDTENEARQDFDTVEWEASGGSIGPFQHVILIDDTTADNTVIGCISYRNTETILDTGKFYLRTPKLRALEA